MNTYGQLFRLTTFGESHGTAVGCVVDGCPAGVTWSEARLQAALNRRRPGQSEVVTQRVEADQVHVLSGVFEGVTLGTPICALVWNRGARSEDYDPDSYRVGHADRVWETKYGRRDWRGGGRASGRETVGRVIGGAIAEMMLPASIRTVGFVRQIGQHIAQDVDWQLHRKQVDEHPTRCPDHQVAERMAEELLQCRHDGDSRGGRAEIWIDGLPVGLGEPVFAKLKNRLADAMMSVGAVIGVSLGDAAHDAEMPGKLFHRGVEGRQGISATACGIQGGISNGERVVLQVFFKPASTVGSMAKQGRHDPCIIPRAIPVLEAMTAMVIADLYLVQQAFAGFNAAHASVAEDK